MRQEHALTVELRTTLNKREEEYKELLKEQKGLVANIWMYREKYYNNQICLVDPFLYKYMKDMEEQMEDFQVTIDQQDQQKKEKIDELHNMSRIQQGPLKMLRTQTEISSHLQIGYKNMMEGLNQEIFQYMQERADLEDQQFEFDLRLKELRAQIRDITEKNQKLIKQIENSKQNE